MPILKLSHDPFIVTRSYLSCWTRHNFGQKTGYNVKCYSLCMLGNFFKYLFLSKFSKNSLFPPIILLIYNLNVKQFGSQMKPHILWGFIWIQIVCKGHQRSSKFTASGLRVKTMRLGRRFVNNTFHRRMLGMFSFRALIRNLPRIS